MTPQDMQQHLYDLLAAITIADFTDDQQIPIPYPLLDYQTGIDCVSTFAEAGVHFGGGGGGTGDTGIVVRMKDGREFNIGIVQTR